MHERVDLALVHRLLSYAQCLWPTSTIRKCYIFSIRLVPHLPFPAIGPHPWHNTTYCHSTNDWPIHITPYTGILRRTCLSCLHLIFILRKTNPQPHTYHTVSACSDRLLTPITWYSHLFSHSFFIWTIGPRPSHGSHLVILTFWFSISHNTRDVKISQFHVIKPINACFTKSRSFCAHFLCTDMCRCMFL